jgi:hypothetical protein
MSRKMHWWDPYKSEKLGCGRDYEDGDSTRNADNVTCAACLATIDGLPELAKMAKAKDKSQEIGRFIDWLREVKGWVFCEEHEHDDGCLERVARFEGDEEGDVEMVCGLRNGELMPVHFSHEQLLAEYFEIDLQKVEEERRAILEDLP